MEKAWSSFFASIKSKPYSLSLHHFLDEEYAKYTVYPPRQLMFSAFAKTDPKSLKAIIIGQDPYHEPGQAMGMSFSVPKGCPLPPSLLNIYKEIENDLGVKMNYQNGDLSYLAEQGVLLLNAYLTVRKGEPLSHRREEYDSFVDDVLSYLDTIDTPMVFLLWGGFAKRYQSKINNPHHLILTSVHPSPLSANRGGWFGKHLFSQTNAFLEKNGRNPIDWCNK